MEDNGGGPGDPSTATGGLGLPSRDVRASGTFTLSNRRSTSVLVALTGLLVLAHVFLQTVVIEADRGQSVAAAFDMGRESSIPTWYAEAILLLLAVVLAVAAAHAHTMRSTDARYWFGLAIVALYMSIDEGSELHEKAVSPTRDLLGLERGFFRFAWVIPFTAIAVALVAVCYRFWRRLPERTRRYLAFGALLFVVGAVFFEMLEGEIASGGHDWGGRGGYAYLAAVTIEEALEFLGVILAISGMLDYLRTTLPDAKVGLRLTP
jgi:hypothetical protein